MSVSSPGQTLEGLRRGAVRRLELASAEKTRITVQVGHCSQAVGALDVASSLASATNGSAHLAVAGCDGACYLAPQVIVTDCSGSSTRYARVTPGEARTLAAGGGLPADSREDCSDAGAFLGGQHRAVLDLSGEIDATSIDEYLSHCGYDGLARALDMEPDEVIGEVETSGLRGRGGAYFPAAIKWKGARSAPGSTRYLVVNSEEGEPCVFKDRHLMEGVPHRVLEGAIIASYAAGIHQAYIYINAEATLSAERMGLAIDAAVEHGLLGDNILGSGFSLDIELVQGAGGYVCGEETTLLNTMEGLRREPRLRPPFPTGSGLRSQPTVINNPETLANVPLVLAGGAAAFAEIGVEGSTGTKLMSLSGSVRRPGVAEVPFGTTLRELVHAIGGGPEPGREIGCVAVGGPSSGVLPESMLDTAVAPGPLHDSGVMLGAGGVVVVDESISPLEVVRKLAAYNAAESCGKCAPCREGTPRMVEIIDRQLAGRGRPGDAGELQYLARVVGQASLCGLGQAAGGPVTSGMHFFGGEMGMGQ